MPNPFTKQKQFKKKTTILTGEYEGGLPGALELHVDVLGQGGQVTVEEEASQDGAQHDDQQTQVVEQLPDGLWEV